MVNLPPDPNNRPSRPSIRDADEAIAVTLAFLAIGTVLWWGFTRGSRTLFPALDPVRPAERSLVTGAVDPEDELANGDRRELVTRQPVVINEDRIAEQVEPERVVVESERSERAIVAPVAPSPATQRELTAAPNTVTTTPSPTAAPPEVETPPPLNISDVPEDYWAYPFIVDLFEQGLLPDFPEGRLQPDNQLTRAEFAALLNSSFVENEAAGQPQNFTDVSNTYWATTAINQVVGAEYMTGYPDATFRPTELVPRYQVLVTLASGLELTPPADPVAVLSQLQGGEEVPVWARGQVAAAVENGLVAKYPDPQQLAPLQPATRGEIVVMIHQALLQQGRVDEIQSPYVLPER